MKKLLFYFAFACVLATVSSCKSDEEKIPVPVTPGAIQGAEANVCPVASVNLSIATVSGAQSYQWYKHGAAIPSATASTYLVTESGTYTVAGVNTSGTGTASAGHIVTITVCPQAPDPAGAIQGATANTCPATTVTLTIGAINRATSYQWYKNGTAIAAATTTAYTVSATGTYTVAGVNTIGTGTVSAGHGVTISVCPLAPDPAGTIQGATANTCPATTVTLTIGAINRATSYQWFRNNTAIAEATAMTYTAKVSGTYTVVGINDVGEGDVSPKHMVSISSCGGFQYADLLGTYTATGTPNYLATPGTPTWTCSIVQPSNNATSYYNMTNFANTFPYLLRIDIDGTTEELHFKRFKIGVSSNGQNDIVQAAFFTRGQMIYIIDDLYPLDVNLTTKVIDFSGVYNYEGVDYDIELGVLSLTTGTNTINGAFTELYKNLKFTMTTPAGASAASASSVSKQTTKGDFRPFEQPLKVQTIKFDPSKFSRK